MWPGIIYFGRYRLCCQAPLTIKFVMVLVGFIYDLDAYVPATTYSYAPGTVHARRIGNVILLSHLDLHSTILCHLYF